MVNMMRSTEDVFEDHLRLRLDGDIEEDLRRNYAPDVILLTCNSNETGHDAIRKSSLRLNDQMPEARFEFLSRQTRGQFALLIWRGTSPHFQAIDGADTFVIENGKIVFQSIHYRLLEPSVRQ